MFVNPGIIVNSGHFGAQNYHVIVVGVRDQIWAVLFFFRLAIFWIKIISSTPLITWWNVELPSKGCRLQNSSRLMLKKVQLLPAFFGLHSWCGWAPGCRATCRGFDSQLFLWSINCCSGSHNMTGEKRPCKATWKRDLRKINITYVYFEIKLKIESLSVFNLNTSKSW